MTHHRFPLAILLVMMFLVIPIQSTIISGNVPSHEILNQVHPSAVEPSPRGTGPRSYFENGSFGGSWSEFFEKGTTARHNGTYFYDDKIQLDINPSTVVKYYNNPVLTTSVGKFDSQALRGNSVIYDGVLYKMWYGGYDGNPNRIGYATSMDGRNWTKQNNGNPVLFGGASGAWDDSGLYSLCVIKDGTTYKMWYSGNHNSVQIGYATSSDGITWTKYASNPVFSGDGAGFDSANTWAGTVIKDGSTYKMWYLGNSGGGGGLDRIGYAWSNDGTSWSRNANAVMTTSVGKFDSSGLRDPAVLKINQKYYMYYTGYDGANYRIGAAESWDGTTWTKMNNGNAVITLGVWDNVNLIEHCAIRLAYQYYIWYAGGGSATTTKIGNAYANNFLKTGSVVSEKINIPKGMKWDQVLVKKAEPSGTGLNISVVDGTTNKTISGYINVTSSGINITGINETTYKSIRLVANLKGSGTATPTLYNWGVSWVPANTWRDTFLSANRTSSVNATRFVLNKGQVQFDTDPTTWTKDPSNPVLTYNGGTWDYSKVMDPGFIRSGNSYYLLYSGNSSGQRAGYATSNDLKTWTKYASNPVLSPAAPSFEEFGIFTSGPMRTEGAVRTYYTGEQSTWKLTIGMAATGDYNNYTKYEKSPILSNSIGQWDSNSVKDPSVLFMNGTYYMWYAGNQSSPAPVYKIGLARSSDGLYWTKPSNNKVLDLGSNGKFDYYSIASPSVVYDKDRYLMFYEGMDDPVKSWKIGAASSTDRTTWTRLNNGDPVLSLGNNGDWDDTHLLSVDVAKVNDLYEMYYVGDSGDGKYQIGHATSGRYSQGTVTSKPIDCRSNGLWNTLVVNKTEPSGTSITVTLLNASTDSAIAGYIDLAGSQIDLKGLDTRAYPKLKLKATFQGDGAKTPVLYDWAINWTIAKIEKVKDVPDRSFPEEGTAKGLYDLSQYFSHKRISNRTLKYTIASETDPVHVKATIAADGYHMDFSSPMVNWTGYSLYTVKVNDGYMNLTSNKFNVTVTNVNDPPFWKKIPDMHMTEDTPANDLVKLKDYVIDSDTSNDSCTYSFTNPDPVNLMITLDANKNLDVVPADNFTGTVKVNVSVNDGQYTANRSFNIIVDGVNDPPVWTPFGPIQMTEDIPAIDIVDLETKVKDAETPTWSLIYTINVDPLAIGTTISSGHKLSITPVANYTGTTNLLLNVSDQQYTATLRVNVIVGPVNDPPFWLPIPTLTMVEDEKGKDLIDLKTYVRDAETPAADLKYSVESIGEPTAVVVIDHGHLIVTPKENYNGKFIVEVSASDGSLKSMTNITIVVQSVNDLPIITSIPVKTAVATELYQYQVVAADVDGDKLTYSLNSYIIGMTIDPYSGLIQWTPMVTQTGSFEVNIQVSDGQASAKQDYFIDVTPKATGGGNPPVIISQPPTMAIVGDLYTYTVQAVDADKDPLTYSLTSKPIGMTIKSQSGAIEWTPKPGMEGKNPVVVTVSDGKFQVTQSYDIMVYPKGTVINHPPVIVSMPMTKALVGVEYRYTVVATDSDGDLLHYYLDQGPIGLVINGIQGLVLWTPGVADIGNRSIMVRVTDGKANVSQSFTLVVSYANQLPTMTSTPVTKATVGKPYTYRLTATDPDTMDKLQFGLRDGPPSMKVDALTGLVTWTPSDDDVGTKTVTIYVTDGIAQMNQTYEIQVTAKGSAGLGIANFPWWIVIVLLVAVIAVIAVVLSRGRKRAEPEGMEARVPADRGVHRMGEFDKTGARGGPGAAAKATGNVPSSDMFKVEEVVNLDDMDEEKGTGKVEGPPKADMEDRPKTPEASVKREASADDIIEDILGKADDVNARPSSKEMPKEKTVQADQQAPSLQTKKVVKKAPQDPKEGSGKQG
jgi:predicted GH43/DUF377 family glycosyl hydrolase